jgi:hypothetical protein
LKVTAMIRATCIISTMILIGALGCGGRASGTGAGTSSGSAVGARGASGATGGSLEASDDRESETEGSAGCPGSAPSEGASCSTVGQPCAYDGCTACICGSDGTWSCPGSIGDCSSCPRTIVGGETCSNSDLTCLRWSFCGGECSCVGGAWSCSSCTGGACGGPSCSDQPSCPGDVPTAGASCDDSGGPCVYAWPSGCAQAVCACTAAGWSCSYGNTGCVDASVSVSETATASATDAGACAAPAAAETYNDASATGCQQRDRLLVCDVPNGSTIELDGSVETPDGASVTCTDTCSPNEYTLICVDPTQVLQPDPSLKCNVIALPTPEGVTNYCCPCSP